MPTFVCLGAWRRTAASGPQPSYRPSRQQGAARIGPRLVHMPSEPSGSQRSPAVRRSRRSQGRSWGNEPAGRTLIRMRSWPRLVSALPCPAGRSIPGRGGPERRRRPRPDGIGQPAGPCWVRMTTGTPGSRRARAVTTGRLNPQVNAPWRRRPGTPEEADGGFESHLLRPCSGTVCARQSGCRLVSEGAGGPDVPGLALGDGHPPAGRPLSPGSRSAARRT